MPSPDGCPWESAGHVKHQPVRSSAGPSQPQSIDESTPITYRYLTFDTDLPTPYTAALDPDDARAALPPQPDLTKLGCPQRWPSHRKNIILALACAATFLTAYSSGSYAPPVPAMAEDLGASELATVAGITTFCVGFALAPMVLAPLSEVYGRRPVLVASGLVYVAFQAVCSVMPGLAGMLVARLLVGTGGSVFSSVTGGVIADVWAKEDRNGPMALFSGAVLGGTGMGPLVASVMMERIGGAGGDGTLAWQWVFWHQVIAGTVLLVGLVFWLSETRGSVLLSRKAKTLNRWYERLEEEAGAYGVWVEEDEGKEEIETEKEEAEAEAEEHEEKEIVDAREASPEGTVVSDSEPEEKMNTPMSDDDDSAGTTNSHVPSLTPRRRLVRLRWTVKEDEERASLTELMKTSVTRPFHLLFTEPTVFSFSLWCAFAWAVLYCQFGSISLAFARRRAFGIEQSGYFFGAITAGSAVATAVAVAQDRLLLLPQWRADLPPPEGGAVSASFWRVVRRRFPAEAPECRLYFTCVTACFLPAGLFLFGFTVRPDVHWVAPAAGIFLATWGIYSVYLATFNYFADIYHKYASSALAAQSCCRNLLGGAFPLVTGALIRNLGEERAGSLLGGIAAGLTLIPWALVFFGETIRSKSRFAISLERQG
ncbi:MFS general substrate transporter [Sodiomyces alkalinus F11]|uniref:MFS general substrate transporter n=1 Tax=Sodiomyces alkalinus (strain CBS 110278 / VKM F-3762 / F11) TaxID=1314773 RepID=A0A3N2PP66_SODAK|nr:MFS general substrate transporter [Sodiomyces alkalinus F11]ROT36317.1 MFS general substrate transporter [Sodiomyces alkalinus F11]